MLHEYWVTLYLIGEAKFWRGNADGGEVMVAAAATAEAGCSSAAFFEMRKEKEWGGESSSLKGPPNPFGKSASDGLSPSISTADSVGSC